jgi:twitching motility protein PilT
VGAQQELNGVRALHATLAPLAGEVTRLRADISAAEVRLAGAKFNEGAIVEQEKRYTELAAAGKTAAKEVAERSRQMQALTEELARSVKVKDEILVELDRVQGRQRDTTSQIQASEHQLARLEHMFKQLDARRSQVVFAEKKADAAPPAQPVAVLGSQPDVTISSPPAVVLSISRNPIRTDQPQPAVSDPTLSGLDRLLRLSSARGASTLYLSSESRPSVRVDGELQELDGEPVLVPRDVESLLLTLMPERNHEALRTGAATEWICDIEGVGRIRCMSFRDHRGPGGVFRLMPTRSVSADQLGLPPHVQSLAMEPEGLVLVVGARSSGKRTLMSAFVDLMNRTRRDHVITIEREINIVHERGNSFVSQREVRGNDDDMLSAARAAMREDPDVLVIEDLHTAALMNVALEAAAAGRLVIGGFSAHTATGAIDRIIDLYAPENRPQVQFALAESLRGVIVQVLLHKIGGGRLPAREVLLNTPAVSSAIAEGKTSQLPMAIEGGRRYGMMPLNDALVGLVQSGVVEAHEAYRRSADRPGFLAALNRQGIDTSFVERLA